MKTHKLFAVLLIGLVAATALVQAFSSEGLTTSQGRVLGKLPAGYIEGKPLDFKMYIPQPNLAPRKATDVYTYSGTRCEKMESGKLRFLAMNRVCMIAEKESGRKNVNAKYVAEGSPTQRVKWSCVKPQVIQCVGENCPLSLCKAPAKIQK